MSMGNMRHAVSIHDVMPNTMARVAELLSLLEHNHIHAVRLLVVPGKNWSTAQINVLKRWQADGHTLAAHGWHHQARYVRSLRHRLHAALMSRDVAEHLALNGHEIQTLMVRSGNWFEQHGLARPQVYVPPAWALGSISRIQLKATGYRCVELTPGELDLSSGRMRLQPLVGFEADTHLRALSLHTWNQGQIKLAKLSGAVLRIAIHPHDLHLRMGNALRRILSSATHSNATAWPDRCKSVHCAAEEIQPR